MPRLYTQLFSIYLNNLRYLSLGNSKIFEHIRYSSKEPDECIMREIRLNCYVKLDTVRVVISRK